MIVDICAYVGKWPYWPTDACTPAEVVEELDRCGIDRAAVCSTRGIFVDWSDGNLETQASVQQFPERLLSFACLGPPELSHSLHERVFNFDKLREQGFQGVRIYPQHHSYHPLYEVFVDQILEESERMQWPIFLPLRVIMNWGVPALSLEWIVALVERNPRVQWILSGINYFHELRTVIWLLRRFSSVYLETSCVQGFNAVAKLVEECGDDRLLFGTGLPLQNGKANLEKVLHAKISESAREKILGGNACRLLRLEESR